MSGYESRVAVPNIERQGLSQRGRASHRGEGPLIEKQGLSKPEVKITQRKVIASFTKMLGLSREARWCYVGVWRYHTLSQYCW